MIKAIETEYKGYRFRSRTEARWAVFFDSLGIAWEYEKEGYDLGEAGWYLPDFWLPEWECFVEIKPTMPENGEAGLKLALLANGLHKSADKHHRKEHYLLCGSPGIPKIAFNANGQLTIQDGYVALPITGMAPDLVSLSCFAMTAEGTALDIWPIYCPQQKETPFTLSPHNIKGPLPYWGISIFEGWVQHLYAGKGIIYDSLNLRMAYAAARSARFEHGEHGTR